MLKRILFVLLVLVSVPFCSFAEGMELDFQITEYDCTPAEEIVPLSGVCLEKGEELLAKENSAIALFSDMTFEEYIVDKVMNATEELPTVFDNLGQFNISKDDIESVYFNVVLRNPQLLLKTAYRYWHYENIVQKIEPVFVVDSVEEAEECRLIMEEKVKEYTDFVSEYSTDLEKLLEIHDKMVAETDYDVRVLNAETEADAPVSVYHAIGVFRDNLAVCQGYSQALFTIAQALDIETGFCYSEEKNHMWNYVKLDGVWYNLDVTNDDPIEMDENGTIIAGKDPRAYHRYFLISDDNLNGTIHGEDRRSMCGEEHPCKNKKYETGYIFNVATPVSFAREKDGMFHALIDVFGGGVEEQKLDFKSKSLRTGDTIASLYVKNNNLYYSVYPTKNKGNAMFMFRAGNSRKTNLSSDLYNFEKNKIFTINFGSNFPDSVTTFLWDAETMAPISQKCNWSKPEEVEDEGVYGIVLAAGPEGGLSSNYIAEVVLEDGTSGIYVLNDKVNYNGVNYDAENVVNAFELSNPIGNDSRRAAPEDISSLVYKVYMKDDKIYKLEKLAVEYSAANKEYDAENMRYGGIFFDDDTVVVSLETAGDNMVKAKHVEVGKVSDYFVDGEGENYTLTAYDRDENNISGLVIGTGITTTISQDDAVFIVQKYTIRQFEGADVYVVTGVQGGKEKNLIFSNAKGAFFTTRDFRTGNILLPGVEDDEGFVYAAELLFSVDDKYIYANADKEGEYYYFGTLDEQVVTSSRFTLGNVSQVIDEHPLYGTAFQDHLYNAEDGVVMRNAANYTLVDFSQGISPEDVEISRKAKGLSLFSGYASNYDYEVFVRYFDEELVDVVVYRYAQPVA